MSFEDDMIEYGFTDGNDYMDYLYNEADRMYERQKYSNSNFSQSELEYLKGEAMEREEKRKEINKICLLYKTWSKNNPIEVRIWEDSTGYIINNSIMGLKKWYTWYTTRKEEESLIENASKEIPILKKLIELDTIYLGVKQFFKECSIRQITQVIEKFKNSNPNILAEFEAINPNIEKWDFYQYFQKKVFNEYIRILNNGYLIKKIRGSFLGHQIPQNPSIERFDLCQGRTVIKFDLSEIRKMQLWINNNAFKWNEWAYNNFSSWFTLCKHAWSLQYQEVWWGKHGERTDMGDKNYYKWCERNANERISFSSEFKRRLILRKLKELHYIGGNVFNNHLALVKRNGKYGYINEEGQVAIKPQFDKAENFNNGIAAVKIGILTYEEYLPEINTYVDFQYGGKWGIIDENGGYLLPPQFDNIVITKRGIILFSEGGQIDRQKHRIKNSKWGIMDTKFKQIIPPKYSYIKELDNGVIAASIAVGINQKWGLLSNKGKEITPFKYSYIYNSSDNYIIANIGCSFEEDYNGTLDYLNGEWGYLDINGHEIKPFIFAYNKDEFLSMQND